MADYILLRQAERYLERMPKNDQIRILEALDTLISDSTKLDIKPLYGRDELRLRLFSTLCDNFCLCKVKCLLGKTFRTILKEETISIDLVYTQKPEEPDCEWVSKYLSKINYTFR